MARISESDLVLPALLFISQNPGISTSELIDSLEIAFRPTGEDAELLEGRSDTKFSQKVRNLVSHHTIDQEGDGFTKYERRRGNGYHWITDVGLNHLRANEKQIEYLLEGGFSYSEIGGALEEISDADQSGVGLQTYPDGLQIQEGAKREVSRQVIKRSSILRNAAIEYYTRDGRIKCKACEFDFEEKYGPLGHGYIEMHHLVPLIKRDGEPLAEFIEEAIDGLVPLCANCHRMVHVHSPDPYSVEELKEIIGTHDSPDL